MDIKFREMESRLNARIDKIAHWQLAIAVVAGIILAGLCGALF